MSANIVTVQAGAATSWFSEGWRLFTKSWLTWLLGVVAVFVTLMIVNFIPILGQLLTIFIQTTLPVVVMIALFQLDKADKINWGSVFEKTKTKLVAILILAAINFGLALIMVAVIGGAAVGGAITSGALSGGDPSAMGAVAGAGAFFAMAMTFLFVIVISLLNYFSAPLIAFSDISAIDAMKLSIKGCLANIVALLVFGVIGFVLAIIAMIPIGLGFLILGPVLCGAWYTSAKQIFPDLINQPA